MKKTVLTVGCFLCTLLFLQFAVASNIPQTAMQSAAEIPPPLVKKSPTFDRKLLEPVDGVEFIIFAQMAYDAFYRDVNIDDEASLKKVYGFSEAQRDHANVEFGKRMKDDASFTLINLYGAYFFMDAEKDSLSYGKYAKDYVQSVLNDGPLYEDAPMTIQEYAALMNFYGRKMDFAKEMTRAESDKVMSEKGMTYLDLQIIGAWIGRHSALGMR
ncbi:hypothetical protein [Bartonella sp. LJL80]